MRFYALVSCGLIKWVWFQVRCDVVSFVGYR